MFLFIWGYFNHEGIVSDFARETLPAPSRYPLRSVVTLESARVEQTKMVSGSVEWLKRICTMLGLSVRDDVGDARCAPHISVNITC
jgi:hypothetical protein